MNYTDDKSYRVSVIIIIDAHGLGRRGFNMRQVLKCDQDFDWMDDKENRYCSEGRNGKNKCEVVINIRFRLMES